MAEHRPVLLSEVLELLAPRSGQRFLDCTFGGGGHTRALLESAPEIHVVALDCDPEAEARAALLEAERGSQFKFYPINFSTLDALEESHFDGVLLDLGLSSWQLERPERGFSFRHPASPDMRFDPRQGQSASHFLETASRGELIRAVRDYGEERRWRTVVEAILRARESDDLASTVSLADLIARAVGGRYGRPSRLHPATRTFQGIRMAVNRELESLEAVLPKVFAKLAWGGVLAVISFHSLEDRMVKRFFRRMAGLPEYLGDGLLPQPRISFGEILTKRPRMPLEEEKRQNPRSRSARLRALRKVNPSPSIEPLKGHEK